MKARDLMRKIRAFVELIALVMTIYAMVATTPLGALLRFGVERAIGRAPAVPELATYFSTDAPTKTQAQMVAIARAPEVGSPEFVQAKALGLRPGVARAITLVSASMKIDDSGQPLVELSDQALASFAEVGVRPAAGPRSAASNEEVLLEGVAALNKRLGSEEAAVAALAVDLVHLEYALDRARASGAASPIAFESMRPYLPPSSRRQADPLLDGVFALATAYEMRSPLDEPARISSPFGYRIHPVLKKKKLHTGIDLAVSNGTKLFAVAAGHVIYATEDSVNGKFVKIDHGHGLTSAYCHASELEVERGDVVESGAVIALSGDTGRATGPHLHFQVALDGQVVDPMLFLSDELSPAVSERLEVDRDGRRFAATDAYAIDNGAADRQAHVVDELKAQPKETLIDQILEDRAPDRTGRGDRIGDELVAGRNERELDRLAADDLAGVGGDAAVDGPQPDQPSTLDTRGHEIDNVGVGDFAGGDAHEHAAGRDPGAVRVQQAQA